MKIVGIYSFNTGREEVAKRYPSLLKEIEHVISTIDSARCEVNVSNEKTMPGKILFDPKAINKESPAPSIFDPSEISPTRSAGFWRASKSPLDPRLCLVPHCTVRR